MQEPLVSNENAQDIYLCRHRSGLRVLHEGKALRVLLVARNSPADKAKWKVGEMIVSVDGRPIDETYWNDSAAQWHERPSGTKVILGMSDGTIRDLFLDDYY